MKTRFLLAIAPSTLRIGVANRRLYALCALTLLAGALLAMGCEAGGGARSEALSETASPETPVEPRPAMSVEKPGEDQVSLPFVVSGWAIDRDASEGTGIEVVQIVDEGCEGAVIGVAEYGLERADIAREYGMQFLYSGWKFEANRLRPGDHTLAVRIKGSMADDFIECQVVQITVE